MSNLAHRLEDIPGVAEVVVDLDEDNGGINIRLVPGADQMAVMDRLRTVLISYGVRPRAYPYEEPAPAPVKEAVDVPPLGVKVRITPIEVGARVEVETATVRSFRIVGADRLAIAQGLADAWNQVLGRPPVALTEVGLADNVITVVAGGGSEGSAAVSEGWQRGLALAVGRAIGTVTE